MSQMNTVPVFKCRYCGTPVYVTGLKTSTPDPDGTKLEELMRGLQRIALCNSCRKKYNYLAERNRAHEMLLNPDVVLLSNNPRVVQ